MVNYEDLGRRIRQFREEQGLTQNQMAKLLGVSPSFEGHLERGTRKASLETLVTLSNATGLTTDFLLEGSLNRLAISRYAGLSPHQRNVMRDILGTLQHHLLEWDIPDEDETPPPSQDSI